MTWAVRSEEEMIALGRDISQALEGNETIGLVGDLGAGKTHFCKGIVEGLGSSDDVTSPTFSLVNEYQGGSVPVYHFDFYRMDSIDEVLQIGWEEYLDSPGVVLVEWADKFPECLPDEAKWCRFSVMEQDTRSVEME